MTKVLPLSRWKKEPPEREAFSDEDSDEEDPEYEEMLIPKKKDVSESVKQTKSKIRSASNQTQNPRFAYQRNQCGQQCQAIKRQKSGLGHQWGRQDRLRAHLQSDSNQINRSPHPSLLENNSRGTNCILL